MEEGKIEIVRAGGPGDETGQDIGRTKYAAETERADVEMQEIKRPAENMEGYGEEQPEDRQPPKKRKRKKKRYRLSGSRAVKGISFVLLALFCAAGIGCGFLCGYLWETGYYEQDPDALMEWELRLEIGETARMVRDFLEAEEEESIRELCRESNIGMELFFVSRDGEETFCWYTGAENAEFVIDAKGVVGNKNGIIIGNSRLPADSSYRMRFYIDPETSFQGIGQYVVLAFHARYLIICMTALFVLLMLLVFAFILYGAGHRTGRDEIVPGVLTRLPLDIMTLLFAGIECGLLYAGQELSVYLRRYWFTAGLAAAEGTIGVLFLAIYFMDLARRIKMGGFWRHSLLYRVLWTVWKGLRYVLRRMIALLKMFPSVVRIMLAYLGVCILEFAGVLVFVENKAGVLLWGIEKAVFFFLLLYLAACCKKLLIAGRELARGQENYRVDTSKLPGELKEHGENLNSVGKGISRAVAAKVKSEHLKTELISNVSHDLKTPLTSIINYADLIWEEAAAEENPRIREYAEVLLRQSRRLKKLLEDLMEASKAATGNLEVSLTPCEVGVFLSQAVGEYQQKMEERGLELIARQPEQPARIMADGRHLWRVFDNLLNNICKYALENT
ncbi:MAG: HAMP domain-containing histidine kinase, partial [Lachnospiraceae bacterium]|nr:HAMP domain-containing histidine kinase [Lachnospiraceae bacterium]